MFRLDSRWDSETGPGSRERENKRSDGVREEEEEEKANQTAGRCDETRPLWDHCVITGCDGFIRDL